MENVLDRLHEDEWWTHFFDGAPAGEERFRQLDYPLLSTSLAEASQAKPAVERRGLSTKATEGDAEALPRVTATTVASDHCPLAITLNL